MNLLPIAPIQALLSIMDFGDVKTAKAMMLIAIRRGNN
jgi:hypothetical protein